MSKNPPCDECDMAPYVTTPCQIQTEDDLLPLLSLDANPDPNPKKFHVPASTIILSRVCVNFLSSRASFSDWAVCRGHKAELLDSWVPGEGCCHHRCSLNDMRTDVVTARVTYSMSKTILKSEGMVLPIGGQVCKSCKDDYVKQFIPALKSIKDDKPASKEEEPKVPLKDKQPSASGPGISPDDIQRRLSLLTPVPPQSDVTAPKANLVERVSPPSKSPEPSTATPVHTGDQDHIVIVKTEIEDVQSENMEVDTEETAPEAIDTEENSQSDDNDSSQPANAVTDEYKFFCKLCRIGFLKETSYKYHMANNKEEHARIKNQKNKPFYKEHNKLDDPHYCDLCHVVLKSESAYKSHYSKLHLERRTRVFYCRECGDIFKCKVDHQRHITKHLDAFEDSEGDQCVTCGKLFGVGNKNAYFKHLATHDDDSLKPCDCPKCEHSSEEKLSKSRRGEKRASSQRSSPRISKRSKSDLLDKIATSFEEVEASKENDIDQPDEIGDEDKSEHSVTCGVCGEAFSVIDNLESHIEKAHSKKKSSNQKSSSSSKERTSRQLKSHKSRCSVVRGSRKKNGDKMTEEPKAKDQRNQSVSAVWQQSESRNWAAEFGYSKNSDDEEEEQQLNSKPSQSNKPLVKSKDILSAMKLNFGVNQDDSTDEEDEHEDVNRNKDGRSFTILNREPRVLSQASRQTRKRLELLTKQAQEKMKEREKSRQTKKQSKNSSASKNNNQVVDVSSGEEDVNVDVTNKDNLLIPLNNGWVCEKIRDKTSERYSIHYWSPDGDHFRSLGDIENHAKKNKLKINMDAFKAAEAVEGSSDKTGGQQTGNLSGVRVKDEETGLPMVIIFPGASDCLTMDVSATA